MIFQAKDRVVKLRNRVLVMGILNVTPDSFSEQGLNFSPEVAVKNGLKMIHNGADIIDIGGESTRPGADPVTVQEEISRITPVLRELRKRSDTIISIDTYKADVARTALEYGADIINDISGFHREDTMKNVAKEFNAGCIVMHMRGTPETMQDDIIYDDIIGDLIDYFRRTITMLLDAGIKKEFICLDPGIGFSKTTEQNLYLINNLSIFSRLGHPLLIGPSRKSFIGNVLNIDRPKDRLWGTAAAVCCAIYRGANIIRVHDIEEMHQVCEMTNAILSSEMIKREHQS